MYNEQLHPPNDEPRRPDGYTFVSRYQCQPGILIDKPEFGQANSIHCPARTIRNQDVLIRLISIDGDATGDDHYEAIRRLSQGQTAFRGDNYALPLLNELAFNGLRFVVSPLLSFGWKPWFYNVDKILDYLMQIFKGVKFSHDNLIAHLDLDSDNILFNFLGGRTRPADTDSDVIGPFRSHFPLRYYINDFELAVCFDKDSDPATRKITGLPNIRAGRSGEYAREYAPEMLVGDPYCPFKADVWYLGQMLHLDMDTKVKGFVEKPLKALHDDFSFDGVFGKYFAQDIIRNEQIRQAFNEYTNNTNAVDISFPKATLRMALSLLTMIAQMRTSNPELRPALSQLVGSVVEMRRECSRGVLSDYIGIQRRTDLQCGDRRGTIEIGHRPLISCPIPCTYILLRVLTTCPSESRVRYDRN